MVNATLMTGLGAAMSIFFSASGSAFASMASGLYAMEASKHSGSKAMLYFIPIIISGVLGIYGMIMAVILCNKMKDNELSEVEGYRNLAAGLAVGLACYCSGMGIGNFMGNAMYNGDRAQSTNSSNRDTDETTSSEESNTTLTRSLLMPKPHNRLIRVNSIPPPTKSFLCVLCFLEALGLYGLIVGLFLAN